MFPKSSHPHAAGRAIPGHLTDFGITGLATGSSAGFLIFFFFVIIFCFYRGSTPTTRNFTVSTKSTQLKIWIKRSNI
jgi:hypothetical protein